jgi:hypothetical protein
VPHETVFTGVAARADSPTRWPSSTPPKAATKPRRVAYEFRRRPRRRARGGAQWRKSRAPLLRPFGPAAHSLVLANARALDGFRCPDHPVAIASGLRETGRSPMAGRHHANRSAQPPR